MGRGGKIAAGVAAAAAAALVAYRLHLAGLSDEDRIRILVEEIQEAFNEGSASGITRRLSAEFHDEESRLGKDEVHAGLVALFLNGRDRSTGETDLRVEVRPEDVAVEVAEDASSARLTVTARLASRSGALRSAVAVFEGRLAKVDGEWKITRASRRLSEGRWPF